MPFLGVMVIPWTVVKGTCVQDNSCAMDHTFRWPGRFVMMYLSVRGLHELILPENLDECHLSLREGKPHANTVAGAPAKGHVTHLGALGSLFGGKSGRGDIILRQPYFF